MIFDKELERRKHRFARYADDSIILVKSKRAGVRVMAGITRYLEKLKVKVNTDKSKVVRVQECSFLGFTFKGKKLTATVKAVTEFKHRLNRLTGRSWGISMQDRYGHIRLYVRGWMNYFGIGMRYTDIMELDHWLTTADQDVLLEAVGQGAKTDWRAYQTWVSEASGDTDGPEQEGLLASCQDVCDQLRVVKRVPTGSGACFSTHTVDRDSLSG